MKGRIFFAVVLVLVALFVGRYMRRTGAVAASNREETRQTQRLDAGARIEVRGINGQVEVRTADTDTAEVRIVRTGDLEFGKVNVELSPSGVVVRGESDAARGFWRWLEGGTQVRQQVTLTVPRRVEVFASGINDNVEVGEVDGPVTVESINGRVSVAQTSGHFAARRVNGGIKVGVAALGDEGMELSRVNGNVEVRLREALNADIEADRHNGRLTLDVPNVTAQEREGRRESRARLGAGGTPIQINRVNGNVRFEAIGAAAEAPPTVVLPVAELPPPPPLPPVR
ncbi:MAG TPA: DUF4097 family beta strand repeat-containing protein [Pyrinomonadaceae bacterium]|nr:DUF4097 family beta strand repeat-containing protein [Pyrinomonadaceae bacterium]